MELHHHNILMYLGGDPSEYPGASGHATNEFLAQVCPQDIVFPWEQGAYVHMRATRAGIPSSVGNTTASMCKEDSEGEWHVALVFISTISDG
jgi:hypothetical protein